jgi:DNA (cytosine-5)-methyltransferase 1
LFGLSLCAGAAGLDLGLHIALSGYRNVCFVEREAYAAAVLVARMEDASLGPAPVWDDVATFDGRRWRGCVDIVLAGYPCQPFSLAGRMRGTDDPRHVWPHIARIVRECTPPFVFLENVAHHLRLGFPEVAGDLVDLGYRIAAGLFTAAEVGAPHRRERLFALAARDGHDSFTDPARLLAKAGIGQAFERREPKWTCGPVGDAVGRGRRRRTHASQRRSLQRAVAEGPSGAADGILGNADSARSSLDPCERAHAGAQQPAAVRAGRRFLFPPGPADVGAWREFLRDEPHLEPAIRRGADGLADRVDRLRLCGNAVVPLAAAHALRILAAELVGVSTVTEQKPG